MCPHWLKEGKDGELVAYRCSRCKKGVHKQQACSGVSRIRDTTDGKLNSEEWNCPKCKQELADAETLENCSNHKGQEINYIFKSKKHEQGTLRLLQWNANSIVNKHDNLMRVLKENKIDVFCIQETRMTPEEEFPNYPGYEIYSKPRQRSTNTTRGGGIAIGISTRIKYRPLTDVEIRDKGDTLTEFQAIEIPISNTIIKVHTPCVQLK